MHPRTFVIILIIAIIITTYINTSNENFSETNDVSDKIHISEFDSLTFYKNKMTTGKRSAPIPQLNCTKGSCQYSNKVNTVQCTKTGVDTNKKPQWKCNTSLPNNLYLGDVDVNCEGYSKPNDEYILKDSCGLNYELKGSPTNYSSNSNSLLTVILVICFIGLVITLIYYRPFNWMYNPYPYYTPYYNPIYAPIYTSYGRSGSSGLSNFSRNDSVGFGSTTIR